MADLEEYHSDYSNNAIRWRKIRDVLDGEYTLKARDLASYGLSSGSASYYPDSSFNQTYLRQIMPSDNSEYNRQRNIGYITGAVFFNGTDRTLQGMMGMLYRADPVISDGFPSALDYLMDNADGSGVGLFQHSKSVSFDVMSIGRDGLMVDMPPSNGQATLADVEGGLRPSILEYKAESIIDWHETVIDGVRKLTMVKLMEKAEQYIYTDPKNIKKDTVKYYKMLYLDDQGNSQVARWKDDDAIEVTPVIRGDGTPFKEVLFTFVGSKNNSPCVDKAPIESIADVNLGHYQESANLASSSFQLSAAQPWIADDNYQRSIKNDQVSGESSDVKMGEGSLFALGTSGRFEITAPPENSLATGLREDYKEQMISLGAQLITSGGQAETAEAARIKHSSDASVLDLVAENVSHAYTKCLKWCAQFMNLADESIEFELNKDFFDTSLTTEQIRELVATWQAGAISKDVLDLKLVKGGIIPDSIDLEEMNGSIDTEAPILDDDESI